MLIASFRHNLSGLLRFSGRSSPSLFWPYVLTLFGLAMLVGIAIMIPEMARSMVAMQRFAAEHPDQATVTQGPGSYSIRIEGNHPELMPDLRGFMAGNMVSAGIYVLLIAAAVIRRLHDSGRRGWWALPPLIFLAIGLTLLPRVFADFQNAAEPSFGLFGLLFLNNIVYLASLLVLILQLGRSTNSAGDRFGPPIPPSRV